MLHYLKIMLQYCEFILWVRAM